jgi:hypothetical protein
MDKVALATSSAVGGALLLGMFAFTITRMFTMNNGKSSTAEIQASTWANGVVIGILSLLLGVCYAVLVLKGGLNPNQKYLLVLVLAVIAFFVSNLALLASSIYVQVN